MASSYQISKGPFKVLVLGSNGMLGSTVVKYFQYHTEYEVVTCPYRAPSKEFSSFVRDQFSTCSAIINCIGAIPQKTNEFSINYQLPQFLTRLFLQNRGGPRIIHATTDCEFSGDRYDFDSDGWTTQDNPDPADDYGRSKVIGSKAIVDNKAGYAIRTSIVGLSNNINDTYSLLDWARYQLNAGNKIKGFTNAKWNGVTTLEWAKIAHEILRSDVILSNRMIQVATERISKYELLMKFKKVFDLGGEIEDCHKPLSLRWLKHEFDYPNRVPFIEYQFEEYKTFLNSEGRNIFPEQEWS